MSLSLLKMNHEDWTTYLTRITTILATFGAVIAGACGVVFGVEIAAYFTFYGVLAYGTCQLAIFAIPVVRKILGKS